MRRTVPLVLAAALLSAACDPYGDIRGFAPAPGTVDKLEVGSQSREDVVRLVGSPSAVGTFNPNVWYYITEKQENWGPSRPWISEQNVIQITFNEQGRVANIKYYDLKDAQNVTMVEPRRVRRECPRQGAGFDEALGKEHEGEAGVDCSGLAGHRASESIQVGLVRGQRRQAAGVARP